MIYEITEEMLIEHPLFKHQADKAGKTSLIPWLLTEIGVQNIDQLDSSKIRISASTIDYSVKEFGDRTPAHVYNELMKLDYQIRPDVNFENHNPAYQVTFDYGAALGFRFGIDDSPTLKSIGIRSIYDDEVNDLFDAKKLLQKLRRAYEEDNNVMHLFEYGFSPDELAKIGFSPKKIEDAFTHFTTKSGYPMSRKRLLQCNKEILWKALETIKEEDLIYHMLSQDYSPEELQELDYFEEEIIEDMHREYLEEKERKKNE